jgi:hypothetical protein
MLPHSLGGVTVRLSFCWSSLLHRSGPLDFVFVIPYILVSRSGVPLFGAHGINIVKARFPLL